MKHSFPVEIRETENREPTLIGTILTEGRAASERRELFAPGSVEWPAEGIEIAPDHYKPSEARAHPVRQRDGRLTISARATDGLREAVENGARYMSVEFHALREKRTKGDIREILSALVVRAACSKSPEYDTTAAEVRNKRGKMAWL